MSEHKGVHVLQGCVCCKHLMHRTEVCAHLMVAVMFKALGCVTFRLTLPAPLLACLWPLPIPPPQI